MKPILIRLCLSAVFSTLPFVMNHYEIYWWSTGAVDKYLFPPTRSVLPSGDVVFISCCIAKTPIVLDYISYALGFALFCSGVLAFIRLVRKRRKAESLKSHDASA